MWLNSAGMTCLEKLNQLELGIKGLPPKGVTPPVSCLRVAIL